VINAYFISGLAADERTFHKVSLPSQYKIIHLTWIPPQPGELLQQYALRMVRFIKQDEPFILVGLSFGGMLASELAKITHPQKVIIISSVATSKELPWYFKGAGKLRLHKIVPVKLLTTATMLNRVMGSGTAEDKNIVYSYVKNADPAFIRWSLNAILTWRHTQRIPGLVHIHGTKDHLLPARYTHPDYKVHKGGHLMVLNRAGEVNEVLNEILKSEA
jgi:surfactin synthase thioesterase subunit